MTLRTVREEDAEILMALRNDRDAVRFSVSGRAVTVEEHERWFRRVRDDPSNCRLWIAEHNGEPIGQVRIDLVGDAATVSIAVRPEHRGRGLGSAMLRAMTARIAAEGAPSRLVAVVRADNTASRRAFGAAGFRVAGSGSEFLELEWP